MIDRQASRDRDGASTGTILLLVADEQNGRVLADHLGDSYDLARPEGERLGDAQFDLCLVDDASFALFRDELAGRKREVAPAFLPYLLLSSADRLGRQTALAEREVDDVLRTPVEPVELDARIGSLLRTRGLTLTLERWKERSDERFRGVFDAAPDPMLVVGRDGRIREANGAFRATFGVHEADLAGASVADLGFSPAEDVERLLVRLETGSPGDGPVLLEWADDGTTVFVELNTELVADDDGETEAIGVFHDVTALKRREAQLLRQNERLEGFAATVAHDLRNPLGIARGFIQQARDTGDEGNLDTALDSLDRMERLVDELLTLARQGEVVIEPVPVRLEAVALEAWTNVVTAAGNLVVERDAALEADPGRLQQALENLVRNAIEHAGGDASIRVGPLPTGDGFYVEDDGPGIPSLDAEQVFEIGYTTSADGTGFGLPIVRQIVEGHGWSISVTDGRDGGARFEVTGVESLLTDGPEE